MTKEIVHSKIGASSMYRWGNCPGSVRECAKIPYSPSSKYAMEGTKAHECVAYYLKNNDWPKEIDMDQDMLDACQIYVNEVLADKAQLNTSYNGNLFLIEHGFKLTEIDEAAFGTADCVLYNVKTKHLIVYDYKHGAGISVDVEHNWQLMYYALGVLLSLKTVRPKTIELKIVQPRCPHVDGTIRSYIFQTIEILDFMHVLEQAIYRTKDFRAPLISGDHCKFCPAAALCPELNKKAMTLAKNVFSMTSDSYEPMKLSETLSKLPAVEAFISAVREFAYQEAMKGRVPPGYKVVEKRATRRWKESSGVGKYLAKHLDSDKLKTCYTEPEIKSPTQIEKILGKDHVNEIKNYVIAESSGYKLAHESDKGEPVFLDAKTLFS